jgi:hypothetical protein
MKPNVLFRLGATAFLLTGFLPAYAATVKAPAKIGLVFSAQTVAQPRQSGVYLAQIAKGEVKTISLLEKAGMCFCCQFISQDRYVISCDGNRLFVSDLQACRSSSLPPFEKPGMHEVQEAAPGEIYTISPTGHLQLCHLASLKTEAVDFPLKAVSGKPEYGQIFYPRLSPDRQKLAFFAAPRKSSGDSGWSLLMLDRAGKLKELDRGLYSNWGPWVSWGAGPFLSWEGNGKIYYPDHLIKSYQMGAYQAKCADLDGRITLPAKTLVRPGEKSSPAEIRYAASYKQGKATLRDKVTNQEVWQGEAGLLGNYRPSPDGKLLAFLVREKKDSDVFDLWLYDAGKKRAQKIFHGQEFSPLRWVKLDAKAD